MGARGPKAKPLRHGTRSAYVRGCHCLRCTIANRRYQRKYLAERRAKGLVDSHGRRRRDGALPT